MYSLRLRAKGLRRWKAVRATDGGHGDVGTLNDVLLIK